MKKYFYIILAVSIIITAKNGFAQQSNPSLIKAGSENSDIKKLLQYYDKQIYFTENKGQWPANVVFKADFPLGQAIATPQGMMVGAFDPASIALRDAQETAVEIAHQKGIPYTQPEGSIKGHGWIMNFVNSSPSMSIVSNGKHPDVFNYIGSDPSKRAMNVNNYQEVWYNNVYSNVDVRYYPSAQGTLEYDIVCKPGFDSKNIVLKLDGIKEMSITKAGHLVLHTSVGDMDFPAPIAYQHIDGKQKAIPAKYKLTGNNELTFVLSKYDESQPLIIDPIALRWASWITNNSTGTNHGHCIWVSPGNDQYGNDTIYIAGKIGGTGLITVDAFQNAYAGGSLDDIELGKYIVPDSVGSVGVRVWQTYLGGTNDDNPYAMQQGPDGNLYVAGYTESTDFPLIGGDAFIGGGASIDERSQITTGSTYENFVVKFDPAGDSWKAAVIGGNGVSSPFDLRITKTGDILVCAYTSCTNLGDLFPGTGATDVNNGQSDILVYKVNSDLSAIEWMKNYGGSGNDRPQIMVIDSVNGDFFVAGSTSSADFPTTNPRQGSLVGTEDGFIQKFDATGAMIWSSYFNAAAGDSAVILCMEFNTTEDKIYFGGLTTGLNSSNIPGSGVYQSTYGGNGDFFVALMDTAQNFKTATYLGGSGNEVNMMGLNVDKNNDVYIFGYSNSTNFPVTSDALQQNLNNTSGGGNTANHDKTFTKLRGTDLDSLDYSTYYGGTQDDYDPVGERGIKFSNCRIYTIVTSESDDLPLTYGAITTNKISSSSVYEPGIVIWANPPELAGNTITGSQVACAGTTPTGFTGSVPSYTLATISRNGTNSPYPVTFPSAANYEWQWSTDSIHWTDIPGGNTQNLSGAQIGPIYKTTYFQRLINNDQCVPVGIAEQTVTVQILNIPATINNVTCYGFNNGSIIANPTNGTPAYQFLWSPGGATTSAITGLSPGTYSVTVTDAASCSDTASFRITQPTAALSATTSSTPATCNKSNGSVTVYAAGGTVPYTYLWSPGSATTSTVSSLEAGTYSVTVTDANKCTFDTTDAVSSTTATSGDTAAVACNGFTWYGTTYTSSGSPTHVLINFQGCDSTVTLNLIINYSDSSHVTLTECNSYTWNGVTYTTTGNYSAFFAGGNAVGCDSTALLCLTIHYSDTSYTTLAECNSYTWNDVTYTTSGNYSAFFPNNNSVGCDSTAKLNLTINYSSSSTNSATACNSYQWNGTTYTTGGNYSIDLGNVNAAGCDSTAYLNLTINYSSSSTNSATACNSYQWNGITYTTGGSYSVDLGNVTAAGCDSTAYLNLTINYSSSSTNSATACNSYQWNGTTYTTGGSYSIDLGNVNAVGCDSTAYLNLTINYSSTGDTTVMACSAFTWYGITYTSSGTPTHLLSTAAGCDSTVTLNLMITQSPTVGINSQNKLNLLCTGSSLELCAMGAGGYVWNTGATTSCISVTAGGTYSVVGTDMGGCSGTDTIAVTVQSPPTITIVTISGQTTFCQGDSVQLCASGAAIYSWNTNATTACIYAKTTGTYSVVGTDTITGCSASNSTGVSANDSTSSQTSATACNTYTWNGITYTAGGIYNYKGSLNAAGCDSTAYLNLTINYSSVPVITVANNCGNSTLSTTATGTLLWNTGSTASSITVTAAGTYSLTQTINGCSAVGTNSASPLTIPSAPAVQVSNNCGNSVLYTTATGSLLWNTGATTSSITVTTAGTYSVTQTISGCTSASGTGTAAPISVSGVPPVVTVVNNCNNSSMLYTTATGSLLWNTGATTSSITVSVAGTYSVTTSSNGCTSPAGTGTAAPKSTPNVTIPSPASTCQGSSIQLCANGANSYVWNTGATTTCITISASGTYSVAGTTNGCTGTASIPVNFSQPPNCSISGNTLICASGCGGGGNMSGGSTQLCAPEGNKSYRWSNGATTQCITVSQTGSYSVTVTNNGGCSSTCCTKVTASTPPSCTISGACSICQGQSTTLCAPGGYASYLWSTGATTSCIVINKAATYSVTVTNSSGCYSTCSMCVTLSAPPSCSISTGCDGNMMCNGSASLCGPSNSNFNTTFSWNTGAITRCITVTSSGTYTLTVTNGNGCSSSCCQKVIVGTTPSCTISGSSSICRGDSTSLCAPSGTGLSYSWSNSATTQCIEVKNAGTYSVTVTNSTGCSSACSKCVSVYNGGTGDTTAVACNSFTWYGTTYTSSASPTHIFVNAGCDSTVTLNLTINHSSSSANSHTACNSYLWNGTTYTTGGSYSYDAGNNAVGCDSVAHLNLTINYSSSSTTYYTACNSYVWNGTTYTTGGSYSYDAGNNAAGCDSVAHLNLTINYSNTGDTTAVACNSFTWYGTTYTSSATPTHVFTNTGGCDSTVTLNLTINNSPTVGINSSSKLNILCMGGSVELCGTGATNYVWNTGATTSCISVTAGGTYSVTGTNSNTCAATDTMTVFVKNPPTITVVTISGKTTFCQGDSVQLCAVGAAVYSWSPGGQATTCIYASATGTYSVVGTDTITGCSGSDTISVIELYSSGSQIPATACNSFTWNGTTYTTGGTYSYNASPNAAGCDSTANLDLTIHYSSTGDTTAVACNSFEWYGTTYTSSGNPTYVLTNVEGCDSTVTLNLTIRYSNTGDTTAVACNSFAWYGATYTSSGTPTHVFYNSAGCDSTVTLNLTVNYSNTGDTTAAACNSFTWYGTTYTSSGTATYILTNVAGCDSTVTLNLTIAIPPPVNITGPAVICQGGTLQLCATGADSYTWNTGETTSCISIDTLVALHSPYAFSVTGPNGSTCPGGAETAVTVNAPPTVGVNPQGSLTFCQGSTVELCASGAVSYVWSAGGQTTSCITVSAGGTYSVTGTDANTCTASASVGVTVNSSSTRDTTASACNSFTWYGTTYTSSGTPTYLLINAAGCDSTVTLNLTINLSDTSFTSVTACDNYAYGNTIYTSSANLYFPAGLNAAGCDSTVNLNLIINHSDTSYTPVTACDSYIWNNTTYTMSGTYSYNASPNAVRCDSIAYLILTINTHPKVTITGDTVLCEGAGNSVRLCVVSGVSYVWSANAGGATTQCINVSDLGKYVVQVTFDGGCSGIDSINVTTSAPPNVTITPGGPTTFCEGGSVQLCASGATTYLWNNGATTSCITATATGTYSVTGTGNSCSAGASIGVTVNNSTTSTRTLSECNSYLWNGTTYTHSGSYSHNASPNAAGCDSTAYLNLTINHSTDTTYSATACSSYLLPWDSTVTQTGQYCHVYNNDGCGRTVCINVTIGGGYANCTISGNTSICAAGCGGRSGNSTTLCAPEGNSRYLWNTGATTQCITVSHAGSYSVTVSNNSGCSSSCSTTVTTSAPPSCEISGSSSICDGQSTSLCAPEGDGYSYSWSNGATTRCITVWKAGTYTVTVTNSGGCFSTCSKCVKVSSGPSCSISTGCGNNNSCEGTTLCGPSNCEWNTTFLWSTGATTRCIEVTASGTYTLTVTNGSGCSSSCCKTVTVGTPPPCTITGNTYICQGECSSLCGPDGDGLSYLWSNGDRTQCIRVTCSGTYYLTVTNSSGCSSTCSICVTVSEAPVCCISGNLSIMRGQCTTLCATRGCESYRWNNGKTTECISVNCPGTYCVTITNRNGCSSTCSVCVVYDNGCGRQSTSPDGIPMISFGNIDASAYPNPFTSLATIEFQRTDAAAHVLIEVYALNGDKVATIFDGEVEAGVVYKTQFDAANLAEGIYMYRIISDDNIVNGKLLLVKN